MPDKLYLIGNGFDLYHGMKTSYSDFCSFVKEKAFDVHDRVERFLDVDKNWSNLEEALGTLDIDYVADDASQFLMSYGVDDWSDAGHHDYQYEIQKTVDSLSSMLSGLLIDWIQGIAPPSLEEIKSIKLSLDKDSQIMNFNYTLTLQNTYGHDPEKIFHVHGNVTGKPYLPILGHSWNPEELLPEYLSYSDEDMDTRVIEGNDILKQYFELTFKPTNSIIEENRSWFESLKHTKSIYVWGHSLSKVDIIYFYEICRHIDITNVFWNISHRNPDIVVEQKAFMDLLGVNKNLIVYKHLSEFST